jgi:Cof subfamily protein (haloacid dehalogenase superfamily)
MIDRQRPRLAAVVSDLDGTALRSDGTLSPLTVSVFASARRRNIPVVIATARTPRAVRKIVGYDQLGVVVCANGAIVWDAGSDEVIAEYSFAADGVAAALERLRRSLPEVGIAMLSADTMYLDEAYAAFQGKRATGAVAAFDLPSVLAKNRIAVVSLRHPALMSEQLIDSATRAFEGLGLASFAGISTVDVVPIGFDKVAAAERVLGAAGCWLREAVAFGDMPNDLGLFAAAGWACAVANAHPSVLAAAREVIQSNDDDGVARKVQQLFDL